MPRSISKYRRQNERKKNASESLLFLNNILNEDNLIHPILSDSAARSILRLSKRHGVRANNKIYQKTLFFIDYL